MSKHFRPWNIDQTLLLPPNVRDHDPDDLSRFEKVVAKLAAASYHEPSARDARTRLLAFFRSHLIEVPPTA